MMNLEPLQPIELLNEGEITQADMLVKYEDWRRENGFDSN